MYVYIYILFTGWSLSKACIHSRNYYYVYVILKISMTMWYYYSLEPVFVVLLFTWCKSVVFEHND